MIRFECGSINKEALKKAITIALIECVANAVGPIRGDYDRTGLDYSECKSETDKRRVFAKDHLGDINFDEDESGVVLNDELYVEGTMNDDAFDLEKFIMDVKKKFPEVVVSGSGEIDYGYSMCGYEIYDEDGSIHVEYEEM